MVVGYTSKVHRTRSRARSRCRRVRTFSPCQVGHTRNSGYREHYKNQEAPLAPHLVVLESQVCCRRWIEHRPRIPFLRHTEAVRLHCPSCSANAAKSQMSPHIRERALALVHKPNVEHFTIHSMDITATPPTTAERPGSFSQP